MLLDGVEVETPLDGALIVIRNSDQPGVIGEVGTILGRHRVNIATFALGRGAEGAVGVVSVETGSGTSQGVGAELLDEIRRIPAVRQAAIVQL